MTFASEEWPEYVGIYNDMAAVYVNGELVPITQEHSDPVVFADVNARIFL